MFQYNLDGSLTNATNTTNDAFSRATYHKHSCLPVSMTGSGASVSLWYDSFGRRAAKVGAVNVSYRRGLHGGTLALSEKIGGVAKRYIETPTGYRVSRAYNLFHRHSLDHLGSVRLRIDAMDCVSAMYSSYGDSIIKGNDTRPEAAIHHTFTGYEIDEETNLMNAWRRIYSPSLARFVAVDPSLDKNSPYLYCNGDPFNHTDPTGEISSAVISGIIAATIFIAAIIISVVSLGVAAPEAAMADVPVVAAADDQATMLSVNVSSMATTVSGYSLVGGGIAAGSTAASNAAGLVTKAMSGEHVSAWQAMKAMLVEPAVAFVTGAIGGAIIGKGTLAFAGPFVTLMSFAAGATVTTASSILINDAIDKRKVDGAELGLQLGIAAAEAMIMMPFFAAVHPMSSIGEGANVKYYGNQVDTWTPDEGILGYTRSQVKRIKMRTRMKYLRWNRWRKVTIARPQRVEEPPSVIGTTEPFDRLVLVCIDREAWEAAEFPPPPREEEVFEVFLDNYGYSSTPAQLFATYNGLGAGCDWRRNAAAAVGIIINSNSFAIHERRTICSHTTPTVR